MKRKITVIDDDIDLRNLLRRALQSKGFEVELFSSANDLMKAHHDSSNLYIIDINLNGISGLDLCRQLKGADATKDVPVLIISAHPEILTLAKDACADDSLTKPFTQKELLDKIGKFVS